MAARLKIGLQKSCYWTIDFGGIREFFGGSKTNFVHTLWKSINRPLREPGEHAFSRDRKTGMIQLTSGPALRQGLFENKSGTRHVHWPMPPSFNTDSLIETRQHLRTAAADETLGLEINRPNFFYGFSESIVRLGEVAISKTILNSTEGYELSFRPVKEYCLNIPLKGEGWIVNGLQIIKIDVDQAFFVSPFCSVTKHWLGPSEVLTLHIPASLIQNDPDLGLPQGLPPVSVLDSSKLAAVFDLIDLICKNVMERKSPLIDHTVSKHLEIALVALVLKALPLEREAPVAKSPAIPYYLRRADHYMRANFRPGLTLADIAHAAEVSPRTLQYGFKQYYGMTPLCYFKRLRLTHARSILTAGPTTKTVSEVAWYVGYQKPSHFTNDYRIMFGENPSRTIWRLSRTPILHKISD